MEFPTLSSAFEYAGEWWIPEKPDVRLRGTLRAEPGKPIRLNLDDTGVSFGDLVPLSTDKKGVVLSERRADHPLIKGRVDATGESVVLLYCHEFWLVKSSCIAEIVLLSDREIPFDSPETVRFQSFVVSCTYLEEWLANFPAKATLIFDEDKKPKGVDFKYSIPESIPIPVQSINGEIRFNFGYTISHDWQSFSWRQDASIEIVSDQPSSVQWFLEQTYQIRQLLAILTGEPVYIRTLRGRCGRQGESEVDKGLAQGTYVYHATAPYESGRPSHPGFMMLSLHDLESNLVSVFNSWFDPQKRAYLEPLCDRFLDARYNPRTPLHLRFLTLAQALESFHRDRYGGEYLSKEEYEPICKTLENAIPTGLPRGLKESLKKRMEYGYQFSLRKRLKELLMKSSTREFIELTRANARYMDMIVSSRNYYTHLDEKDREKALKGEGLRKATVRLAQLTLALILHELGLSGDLVKEALNRYENMLSSSSF